MYGFLVGWGVFWLLIWILVLILGIANEDEGWAGNGAIWSVVSVVYLVAVCIGRLAGG